LRGLPADLGQDVTGRLPSLAERDHDHRPEGLAAGRVRDGRVVAHGIDAGKSVDAAEGVAGDATAHEPDRKLAQQRIGSDPDRRDDASCLDPGSVRERD